MIFSPPGAGGGAEGNAKRKLIAGFSTGEYGIVTIPNKAVGGNPSLGELFQPALPSFSVAPNPLTPQSTGLGSYGERLGGLAKATGGLGLAALGNLSLGGVVGVGKKLDKNGVVVIPPLGNSGGRKDKAGEKGRWLYGGNEWGWEEAVGNGNGNGRGGGEGEVLVVRESES